ncbi:hypothetical protein [Paractinoplanes brasiliensis]|uniref:Uncharacterized protein n=1 Tax=Paractinoplanes brasiliensis TaxID=52695 RepID=A0A4R6JSC2_9ACTN|nr:hypothetical protein [Actinoplanes brasiliensis]TDO38632.1 hypothetical protein C8E87_2291 [Actinoplanes brasiliensis]GID26593.1 hypothetical protein Abr02nite_15760 [Actinoplanes brasiliensis]
MTDFATSVDRLLNQIRVWEQPRWNQDDRAARTFALVQRLADLGADAEGRPRREVPREHDMILPDQVRVLADDLLAAGPESVLVEAAAAVDELRAALNR